jgi:hypothetical protein
MISAHLHLGPTFLESSTKLFPSLNLLAPVHGMVDCVFLGNRLSKVIENGTTDLDILEVGNTGLTVDEQQTHFAFWAAAK